MTCPYCGDVNPIPTTSQTVDEQNFLEQLEVDDGQSSDLMTEVLTVRCQSCGAQTTLGPNVTAGRCPFCDSPIIAARAQSQRLVKPKALLPFAINRDQAMEVFGRWLKGLWFAPDSLKRTHQRDGMNGVYLPAWTYDTNTQTVYVGERGEDYYETQWSTVLINGRSQRQSRNVKKTRWYPANGQVMVDFDDVLVMASQSLPGRYVQELEPWDLKALQPYQPEYLAGFFAESYQVNLQQGFEQARALMEEPIRQNIRQDIGGDRQRIYTVNTSYHDISFKHILLPIWISTYHYGNRTFMFVVNARTGEVQGDRPYSWVKITLLVVLMCGLIVLGLWMLQG